MTLTLGMFISAQCRRRANLAITTPITRRPAGATPIIIGSIPELVGEELGVPSCELFGGGVAVDVVGVIEGSGTTNGVAVGVASLAVITVRTSSDAFVILVEYQISFSPVRS